MWTDKQSIALSKFCVYLFMVLLAAGAAAAPWLAEWYFSWGRWGLTPESKPLILASVYCALPPAALLLWELRRFLGNIGAGRVFIPQNVRCLRRISWCCIAGGLVCLASALYYLPFLAVSAAAAFVALIVRVIKNVFEQAILLKDEMDHTI